VKKEREEDGWRIRRKKKEEKLIVHQLWALICTYSMHGIHQILALNSIQKDLNRWFKVANIA